MEIIICYILIYIIEALILWQYCSGLFFSKYSKRMEFLLLITAYFFLFLVSLKEEFWINFLVFIFVNFAVILVLYRIKWYAALFHSSIIATIMSLSELGILSILSHFTSNFYEEHYFRNVVILSVFSKLIYFFILRFIVHFLDGEKEKNVQHDKGTIFFDIMPLISIFIIMTLTAISLKTKLPLLLDWMISASAILLLFMNLLIFWVYNYNQNQNYKFMKLQLQLQKEYDATEYNKMLLKQDETQKILIHDIKKHLHSISALNEKGEQRKIAVYIDQIIHSSDLQTSVHVCDNELLNAILCRYIKNCKEKEIPFRIDIRKGLLGFLSYEELTALFCNLLDNAFESVSKIPEPYIELNVSYKEKASLTMLTMINSCINNPISPKTGQLISKKQNRLRHGYGMKSVQKIVKKYHGDIQVYYDEKNMTFHTIITLKEPQKK